MPPQKRDLFASFSNQFSVELQSAAKKYVAQYESNAFARFIIDSLSEDDCVWIFTEQSSVIDLCQVISAVSSGNEALLNTNHFVTVPCKGIFPLISILRPVS
jgi:hypothetical protein